MADESRNPQDNINLPQLRAELSRIAQRLASIEARQGAGPTAAAATPAQTRRTVAETTDLKRKAADADKQSAVEAERAAAAERSRRLEADATERNRQAALQRQRAGLAGRGPFAPGLYGTGGPTSLGSENIEAIYAAQRAAEERARAAEQQRRVAPSATERTGPPVPPTRVSDYARETEAARVSQAGFNRELVQYGVNAQRAQIAMTRHGALTTEFIQATARGEVTVAELGRQVGLTIGKFAGWTAAATSVFAVVGAIDRVRQGAIAAASGVDLVARVLPAALGQRDRLQGQFADLAHQMNLPISDVTQAVYGMGKVFHDLPSALSASQQALFAVKVGELDAATATRYLTAIVNGFQLQASELPQVFDTINQAQNRFGGNTGQMVAGVAKAAGAFRLAGGSYRELIALIQTGVRLTGASGENVGTAIARSASTVLTPQGQARLIAAGLNPRQRYTDLLRQAMQLAQRPGTTREEVQQLARALVPAGGQFTRIFAPLLQNQQLYQRVYGSLGPDQVRGSATRELARAKAQADEQIKAIGYNLEQLGVQLVRIGALDPFLGIVKGANTLLHTLEALLSLVNNITGPLGNISVLGVPLRHVLGITLELAAATAVARRFDVGRSLPILGSSGGGGALRDALSASPAVRARRDIIGASREFETAARERRDTLSRLAFNKRYDAELTDDLEQRQRLVGEAADLDRQRVKIEQDIASAEQSRAGFARDTRGAVARSEQAVRDRARNLGLIGGATPATQYSQPAGPLTRDEAAAAEAERRVSRNLAVRARSIDTSLVAMRESAQGWSRYGAVAGTAGRTIGLGVTAVRGAGLATAGLAAGLRSFGRGIASALGPLDAVLLGTITIYEAVTSAQRAADRREQDLQRAAREADVARLQQLAQPTHHGIVGGGVNAILTGSARLQRFLGLDANSPDEIRARQQREAASELRYIKSLQSQGQLLKLPDISQRLERALAVARTPEEQLNLFQRALRQTRLSAEASSGDEKLRSDAQQMIDSLKDRFAAAAALVQDVDKALSGVTNATGLKTFLDATVARLNLAPGPGGSRRGMQAITAVMVHARRLLADGTITEIEAWQALQAQMQAAEDQANTELQRALLGANSAGSQGRARATYLKTLSGTLGTGLQAQVKTLRDRIKDEQERINALLNKVISASQEGYDEGSGVGQGGQQAADQQRSLIESLKTRRDKLRSARDHEEGQLRQLRAQQRVNQQRLREIRLQTQRDQYTTELDQFDAHTQVLQSQTTDPQKQASLARSRLLDRVRIVREAYRRGIASLSDLWRAIAQANESLAQLAQANLSDFQEIQQVSSARYGLSHIGDQGATLNFAVQQARSFLDKVRSTPGHTASQIRQARIALYNAQAALAQYAYEQGQQMIQARLEFDNAAQDNPVKRAVNELHAAEKTYQKFPGRTALERLQQLANIRSLRYQAQQTKQQDAFDTIEFEAQMDRITRDQEIQRLRMLEKTIRGNRDLKRQIELRIHELQNASSDVELNVGDIRLPTLYDVRRLAKQGTQNALNVHQNFQIQIDGSGDPTAVASSVYSRFARESGGGLSSAARTAGVR